MKYLEGKGADVSGWTPIQSAPEIGAGDAVDFLVDKYFAIYSVASV